MTKEYIRRANAVFVCIDAQKIQSEEINTISSVFSFSSDDRSKVHIIATHWDKLNDPETDWDKQKKYLIKRLTGPAFFEKQDMAAENIMHSAAFIYNLCRDIDSLDKNNRRNKKLLRDLENFADDTPCAPDDLEKIGKRANVTAIMKVIREKLAANYKKLLAHEIQSKFMDISYNLNRATKEKKDSMNELLAASYASEQELEQKLQEQIKKCDAVKISSDQLQEMIKQVKRKTNTRADLICGKLRLKLSTAKK